MEEGRVRSMLEGCAEVCKVTRKLSLRGKLAFSGVGAQEILVFENQSPDRTRAWKVTGFQIWIESNDSDFTPVHKTGGEFVISGQMQTDKKRIIPTLDCADNRTFGWVRNLYRVSSDLGQVVNGEMNSMTVIDPEHILVDELFLQLSLSAGSDGENMEATICYLVLLEQVKVSEAESILQFVKGKSQDVDL